MAMAETASASGSSGIEGVIMVSPSRPGPIRKDRPNAAPARDVTFAVKRADVKVAAFTTDGEGRFRVALPPGRYIVFREDAGSRIGRWQFEAEVVAGEMIKVTWTADSGMR
jgi:hypothetical protein